MKVVAGGYLKDRTAKITVHEAEQIFQELWAAHEAALLLAFERRFQLVEARVQYMLAGQGAVNEQVFLDETRQIAERDGVAGDVS